MKPTGPPAATPHGRRTAWITLIVAGLISWGVNMWDAFFHVNSFGTSPRAFAILATLYGTAPVILAALQSHEVASRPMGRVRTALTYLVLVFGMILSFKAQAEAVEPFAGPYLAWLFPAMVDLSAFLSLHTIMTPPAPESAHASRPPARSAPGTPPAGASGRVPEGPSGTLAAGAPGRVPERDAAAAQSSSGAPAQVAAGYGVAMVSAAVPGGASGTPGQGASGRVPEVLSGTPVQASSGTPGEGAPGRVPEGAPGRVPEAVSGRVPEGPSGTPAQAPSGTPRGGASGGGTRRVRQAAAKNGPRETGDRPKGWAWTGSAPPTAEEIIDDVLAHAAEKFPSHMPGVAALRHAYGVGPEKATSARDQIKNRYPEGSAWPPDLTQGLRAVRTGPQQEGAA